MRLLLWLVVVVLVIWAVLDRIRRGFGPRHSDTFNANEPRREIENDPSPPHRPPSQGAELMLACAHCGVFIPASDALRDGEQVFCCEAHRRQFSDKL